MPFRFAYICNLLEKLHHIFARHPPYLPRDVQQMSTRVVTLWFRKHELKIKQDVDGCLLLSILLPEKYAERVYGLSERDIAKVVGRAFSLSTAQFEDVLHKANAGDLSDLGHRVEQVTKQCNVLPYSRAYVTSIEEIDQVLALVASQHSFAAHPSHSHLQKSFSTLNDKLGPLYQCLTPRERKWLTRLILKCYGPIIMPEDLVFSLYHPLLPGLINVNFGLKAALRFISRLEGEPAPAAATGYEGEETEALEGNSVAAVTTLPSKTEAPPVNDENVPVLQGENVPRLAAEPGTHGRPVQELMVPSSSNVQAGGSINSSYRNASASPRKASQPLSDITKNGGNRSPVKSQKEKLSITGRHASQSNRRESSQLLSMPLSASLTRPRETASHRHICPKEGKHCLFHKKGIGLLPSVSSCSEARKLLAKHQIATMSFDVFLKASQKRRSGQTSRRRRLLFVDRSLDEVQAAVEQIRALPLQDMEGRKQWVDIYDWRLLDYVDKHGGCRDSKLECVRRYWIGTV